MATKECIIPVRVTRADRDLLKRMAPGGAVSSWLRDLGLTEARKRRAAADVSKFLDGAGGSGLSEAEAAKLAAEALRAVRTGKR
jgi:hypothetical protein